MQGALRGMAGMAPGGPWVGKGSAELVSALGVPDKTMKLDDEEVWEYDRQCQNRYQVWRDADGQVSSVQPDPTCHKWLFQIKDGKVVGEK